MTSAAAAAAAAAGGGGGQNALISGDNVWMETDGRKRMERCELNEWL